MGTIALMQVNPNRYLLRDHLTFTAVQNPKDFKIGIAPLHLYALTRSATRYQAEKPVVKVTMGDVLYDFSNMNKKVEKMQMNPVTISNYHNLPQKVHRTLTYAKTKTKSFTGSWKVAYGTDVQVSASIPSPIGIVEIDSKTTVTDSWQGMEGDVKTNTTTEAIKASVDVPANSKMTATIIANKYTTDIPYTAMMTKFFYDGSSTSYPVEGQFKGVDISEVQVQYRWKYNLIIFVII